VVEIAKDDIEVDGFSTKDVSPFRLGESLWSCGRPSDVLFRESDVTLEDSEDLSRLLSVLVKFLFLCIGLNGVPW
jgi:hypothetical protein